MGSWLQCRLLLLRRSAALVVVDGFLRRNRGPPEEAEKLIGPYRAAGYRERMARFVSDMFPYPADYRIMEGVGHFLMLEKPAEFNATLADMLRELPVRNE